MSHEWPGIVNRRVKASCQQKRYTLPIIVKSIFSRESRERIKKFVEKGGLTLFGRCKPFCVNEKVLFGSERTKRVKGPYGPARFFTGDLDVSHNVKKRNR